MRFGVIGLLVLFLGWAFDAGAEQIVATEDMAAAVREEFAEQGINDEVELEFFGGQTSFVFEQAQKVKILVSGLEVNRNQGKFTAEAEVFADGVSAAKTKLSGKYFVLAQVFLPVRDIAKGELISEDDLAVQTIRANRLREDTITAKEDLLGKQVIKSLKSGRPVSFRDVSDEIIIKKGQSVTVIYIHRGLQITSKMEALENGAKGQKIKLLNTKSQKEVWGLVVDKNTAEIATE